MDDPRCYCTRNFFPCRYCFYAPNEPPDEVEREDKMLDGDAYRLTASAISEARRRRIP